MPAHIPLTPGGAQVMLMGSDLPMVMPGRPLDRCTVLNQIKIENSSRFKIYWTDDFDNALRNRTAQVAGNVAIRTMYRYTPESWQVYEIQGMALWCPEDVLKAAGLSRDLYQVIDLGGEEEKESQTSTVRTRPSRDDSGDQPSFEKRGVRDRIK